MSCDCCQSFNESFLLQVTRNLRIFCEDGHSFIPASFKNIYHEAFPPYSGKPASNRQLRMGKKALRTGTGRETSPTTSIHATEKPRNRIGHFIMNLPDSAISFLGAFRGVLNSERRGLRGLYFEMPMVHCYCFTRFLETTEAEADIKKVRGWYSHRSHEHSLIAAGRFIHLRESRKRWETAWRAK